MRKGGCVRQRYYRITLVKLKALYHKLTHIAATAIEDLKDNRQVR